MGARPTDVRKLGRAALAGLVVALGVTAAGDGCPGHISAAPAVGSAQDGRTQSPERTPSTPVERREPVPLPRVEPVGPGPVPMPHVEPAQPGSVEMPKVGPHDGATELRPVGLDPDR